MNKITVYQKKNEKNTINLGTKLRKIESGVFQFVSGLKFVEADVGDRNVSVTLTFDENSAPFGRVYRTLIGHIVNDALNDHVPFGHMYTAGDD